ncbi:uncharacterized protein LOC123529153 [Mercenaria mercenaria]|uniref:uncharacterized protein LOC123529153 n=1 Tax=Mercenaria mercenaria TaxID=6596 RepID=UPI00234E8453|nr:uncharacterized protein LOC123529153 [Mercenaria mercenaria]
MVKNKPQSPQIQKSRESSYVKGGQDSTQNSRPISQERQKRSNNGSRRNSVFAMLPKTPPGTRRFSVTPDKENIDATNGEERGADVASKASAKVSKFLDYYNEALRRRLERELLKPAPVPKVAEKEESDRDTDDNNSDGENKAKPSVNWQKAMKKTTMISKIADAGQIQLSKKVSLGSHALTQINKKKAVKQVQMLLRRLEVRKKFRKKTRIIIFCIRCVRDHSFKFRERSELTPYMNTLNYIDYKNDQVKDLMFDRSQFSANKQMRISEETKRILCKRKSLRTENEVYSALIALRNIRSFAELPVRMQQMIAAAGQYESYEGKRVITREGHPSSAFYFILSGAAVAMKMDPERPIASAVKEFSKGDNFEENAMLNDTVREVTVLTKESCEFLSISASDYKNIFMQGGVKNLNDPDQELFLKSLHFLDGWPIKILLDHPKECRFYYFKRGVVFAEDSRKSPWLIVVKSGSLSVMKKLKKVGPFEWRKNSGIKPLTEKESRERLHERRQWRRYVLPELRINLQQQNEFEEIEERVDGKPKPFQHPDIKVHMEGSGSDDGKGKKYYYPNLWSYSSSNEEEKGDTFSNINKQFLYTISSHTARGGKRKAGSVVVNPPQTAPELQHTRPLSETRSVQSPVQSETSDISLRSILMSPNDTEDSARTPTSVFDERIKTIAAGVHNGGVPLSEIDINPQFVHIRTLIKGDVWGLADLMLDDQPSFIIVSNGADCVLISKSFYQQHCSEKLQRKLKHDICPYPSDEHLQDSLQLSVDWNEHRRCELSDTVKKVRELSIIRDTTFPNKILEPVK